MKIIFFLYAFALNWWSFLFLWSSENNSSINSWIKRVNLKLLIWERNISSPVTFDSDLDSVQYIFCGLKWSTQLSISIFWFHFVPNKFGVMLVHEILFSAFGNENCLIMVGIILVNIECSCIWTFLSLYVVKLVC